MLSYLADILIDAYAAESAVLRAQDAAGGKRSNADAARSDAAQRRTCNEAAGRIELAARRRWRRWPTATCCGRSWRRCAGC